MSDDDSSSSEDIPLSSLGGGKRSRVSINYNEDDEEESDVSEVYSSNNVGHEEDDGSSEEAEFDGEEEEEYDEESDNGDVEEDDFIVEDDEEDSDGDYNDESSEDVPLSTLKTTGKSDGGNASESKKSATKSPKSTQSKKSTPKKKSSATKTKKSTSSSKNKKSLTKSSSSSSLASLNIIFPSTELYTKCEKGKLIQSVLARWWYAYQWPDPNSIPAKTPKGYDALDGFPGVYICTSGDDVGKFKDVRDMSQAPSFRNFAKKTSAELREMLLAAIEKQLNALIKVEGEGTVTEKELKALEKWAVKLNCTKADKEAEKVLKAVKLLLT